MSDPNGVRRGVSRAAATAEALHCVAADLAMLSAWVDRFAGQRAYYPIVDSLLGPLPDPDKPDQLPGAVGLITQARTDLRRALDLAQGGPQGEGE